MPLLSSTLVLETVDAATGSQWLSCNEIVSALLPAVSNNIVAPDDILASDLLKQGTRRLVFKFTTTDGYSLVVKAFPLIDFKHKLKHKKYAFNEAVNLLLAAERGLKVPKLLAYGYQRSMGLTHWNALCMEEIKGTTLQNVLKTTLSDGEKITTLEKISDILISLYEVGCNHIDINGDGIIFRDNNASMPHVIDFQYCVFHEQGKPEILAAQAGHLSRHLVVQKCVTEAIVSEWFSTLLTRINAKDRAKMPAVFARHLNNRISIKERLSM